jgi:hypothetical protein
VKLKVLTLHQPWASLVIDDVKRIETRSWGTSHRGTLAIHAGKVVDHGFCEELGVDPCLLPVGQILGTVQLLNCELLTPRSLRQISDAEKRYGLFRVGRFAWHLHFPRKLSPPIPARGLQLLWNFEVPTA